MKNLTKIVLTALTAIVLVSGVAVLTPRAVHAVVATFVRDVDNGARHPWSSTCSSSAYSSTARAQCSIVIPAGEEVVIQQAYVEDTSDTANKVASNTITLTTGGNPNWAQLYLAADVTRTDLVIQSAFAGQITSTLYADPGSTVTVYVSTANANPVAGLGVMLTLSGYTVSLP